MPNNQIQYPEGQEGLFIPSPRPTRHIFEHVVSGGQTGADQGALDAALKLGHTCGGWCPMGRRSEAGRIPDRYPLQEHTSTKYPARTEANVRDSDGTLIFTYGEPTGGTALTVKLARLHRKPRGCTRQTESSFSPPHFYQPCFLSAAPFSAISLFFLLVLIFLWGMPLKSSNHCRPCGNISPFH